ncbi:MAG: hypothetical protein WC455_14205 [Dehalococcoidia bacterium]|jgi:hypothetical protein
MKQILFIIIVLLCFATPALADEPPPSRPDYVSLQATKAASQPTATAHARPTVTPTPWAYPAPVPYPEPEFDLPAWLHRLLDWVME